MSSLLPGEYYGRVYPSLEQSFERSDYLLGYGKELVQLMDFGQNDLPVTVQPVSELRKLSVDWNLEVFVPVRGRDAVLFPFDFEVALKRENTNLYVSRESQRHFIERYIFPVSDFLENYMHARRIPFLIDFTPSGGHLLFYALRGSPAWQALASVGFVEKELTMAYQWIDTSGADLKRQRAVNDEEGKVFSAFSRLAEYLGLVMISSRVVDRRNPDGIETHLCDASERALNIDISWGGDPLYMRIMRAPCSLHRKNMNYYQVTEYGPLCDTKSVYYDTFSLRRAYESKREILDAQWDLERGAEYNSRLPGHIPFANDGLVGLVDEYRRSPLYGHHQYFDRGEDLPIGEARHRALNDERLSLDIRNMISYPNPRLLQPESLKRYMRNMLDAGWHPRHAANAIRDCYLDPSFNWSANWLKCPAATRSNFWARIYASVYYLENGEPVV